MKEEINYDPFNLKEICTDAVYLVSEAKVMDGVEPTLTSGDYCIGMYLLAYQNKSISRDFAIKTTSSLIKNGYATKTMIKKAEKILKTKF